VELLERRMKMDELSTAFIRGVAVAIFLEATTDLQIKDFKWWAAMLSLVVVGVL